jgi:hypothetical protein
MKLPEYRATEKWIKANDKRRIRMRLEPVPRCHCRRPVYTRGLCYYHAQQEAEKSLCSRS